MRVYRVRLREVRYGNATGPEYYMDIHRGTREAARWGAAFCANLQYQLLPRLVPMEVAYLAPASRDRRRCVLFDSQGREVATNTAGGVTCNSNH